jgi:hypothetical protein
MDLQLNSVVFAFAPAMEMASRQEAAPVADFERWLLKRVALEQQPRCFRID